MEPAALAQLESKAHDIAKLLKLVANEQRMRVLWRLANSAELSVAALAAGSGVSQSALSQNLGTLRKSGLVVARKVGQRSLYRLADTKAARLVVGLQTLLQERTE